MKKEKIKKSMPDNLRRTYKVLSYLFLGIVVFAMVFYQNIIITTKGGGKSKRSTSEPKAREAIWQAL